MSALTSNATEIVELARKNWHTIYALVLAEILLLGTCTSILLVVNPSPLIKLAAYLTVGAVALIVWWRTNRLPKTAKNKLGFVISISTGEESERKKIMEDFVLTLQQLLKDGAAGHLFQLIKVPQHVAETIVDIQDAQALRARCRAHFMIYGRVRLRPIAGRQEHILDLSGMVVHRPLADPIRAQLRREFSELLPHQMRINVENDFFSFAFTSDWVNCVSKYIIGIAAFYSGDLKYAELLWKDVDRLLDGHDKGFPIFAKLKQRVPRRLGEISLTRANMSYNRWADSYDSGDLQDVRRHLDAIPQACAHDYGVIILRSILKFLVDRDVRGAIALLKKCKHIQDGTWLYNLGFLYAYKGDLKAAIRFYRKAETRTLEPIVIARVEDFMCWVLEAEPDKYQLHYCLGDINWKIKGDEKRALEEFRAFLSLGNADEYAKERELARSWILELTRAAQQAR